MERIHSVYVARGHYDGVRRVLYVGVSSRGMARFHEHAGHSEWWRHMSTTSWYHRSSRKAALKTERLLIEKLDPVFNQHRKGR